MPRAATWVPYFFSGEESVYLRVVIVEPVLVTSPIIAEHGSGGVQAGGGDRVPFLRELLSSGSSIESVYCVVQ